MLGARAVSLLFLLTYSCVGYAGAGSWRLELKTLNCLQVSFDASELTWALAANGNPCNPIGDGSGENSFVMIECPRTGTNYVLAPTKESCLKAAAKLKAAHSAIKDSEGAIPFKKIEEKQKQAPVAAPKKIESIEGVWQRACEKHPNQLYTVQTRKYSKNTYEIKYDFYAKDDANCEKEISHVDVIKGRYKLEGIVDSKQKAYGIQSTPEKYFLIPKQDYLVTELTEASHAGILSWSLGKEHDVSKANKIDGTKTFYGLFSVTSDQLSLGTPVEDSKANRSMADARVFKKVNGGR